MTEFDTTPQTAGVIEGTPLPSLASLRENAQKPGNSNILAEQARRAEEALSAEELYRTYLNDRNGESADTAETLTTHGLTEDDSTSVAGIPLRVIPYEQDVMITAIVPSRALTVPFRMPNPAAQVLQVPERAIPGGSTQSISSLTPPPPPNSVARTYAQWTNEQTYPGQQAFLSFVKSIDGNELSFSYTSEMHAALLNAIRVGSLSLNDIAPETRAHLLSYVTLLNGQQTHYSSDISLTNLFDLHVQGVQGTSKVFFGIQDLDGTHITREYALKAMENIYRNSSTTIASDIAQ